MHKNSAILGLKHCGGGIRTAVANNRDGCGNSVTITNYKWVLAIISNRQTGPMPMIHGHRKPIVECEV